MEELIYRVKTAPVWGFIFLATVVTSLMAMNPQSSLYQRFVFNPFRIKRTREYDRFLTHTLLHAGLLHLFFNMYVFWVFGYRLEASTSFLGSSWKMGVLYVVSAVFAGFPAYFRHQDFPAYNAVGASGAISGVLYSYILFDPTVELVILFFPFFPFPAWGFGAAYLLFSFLMARSKRQTNIAHDAHFWGAVTGLLLTAALVPDSVPGFFRQVGL